MAILTVELHQFRFKVPADAGKDRAQVVKNLFREDFPAVFGHEDQIDMYKKNAVSSLANPRHVLYAEISCFLAYPIVFY